VRGYKASEIIKPEPNTNLMAPRTMIPTLKVQLSPGKHTLCCAVYGSPSTDIQAFDRIPQTLLRALKDMKEISK
jgi:hypothetical protein